LTSFTFQLAGELSFYHLFIRVHIGKGLDSSEAIQLPRNYGDFHWTGVYPGFILF